MISKPFVRIFAAFLSISISTGFAGTVRLLPYGGNLLDARLGAGTKAKQILLFANTVSAPISQATGESLVLTRLVPAPDGNGTVEQVIARSAPLPEGVNAVLYLLVSPMDPATAWQLIPMEESVASLKKGSFRVLNFSSFPVAVRLASQGSPSIVSPRGQAFLQRLPEQTDIRVEAAAQEGSDWVPVMGRNYGFSPDERTILLVTPASIGPNGERNGLVNLSLIREQLKESSQSLSPSSPKPRT